MAQDDSRPFNMRVSERFLKQIDDWRRRQDPIPSRAEAIRQLVSQGIKSDEARRERPK
jgi:metal-responsive CopG/Arc/MetJ family transcriptional regulator